MSWENVDLTTYDLEKKGAFLIHATGDVNFNIGMRAWLKQFGWSFSQAGLKNEKGEIIAAKDEKDIFAKMGMDYIEPQNRIGFTPPKTPPPGATKQPYGGTVVKPTAAEPSSATAKFGADVVKSAASGVLGPLGGFAKVAWADIYAKLPDDIKAKVKDFKLPNRDEQGNAIPINFLWDPKVRHLYYKSGGTYRLPQEMKLDRYGKE